MIVILVVVELDIEMEKEYIENEDDLETMKEFVKTELEADKNFHFPSGKVTSRMNLGQICKIAFELSHLTQK